MAAKLPGIVYSNDAYTDDVLKCIKDTLKQKSGDFTHKYDGSKAFTRNDSSYITEIVDEGKSWREKFSRRKKNLQYGFFADKSKPYQPLGKVYLESGELILQSITDDLRCKIARVPIKSKLKSGKLIRSKKGTPLQKSLARDRIIDKPDAHEATSGFYAIKQRLNDVHLMRKGVHATQGLHGYICRKEQNIKAVSKEDEAKLKPPAKSQQWKKVRAVGRIMGAVQSKDSRIPVNALPRAFRKKGGKPRFSNTGMGHEIEEFDNKEETLRWRRENKRQYLQNKLQAMNSILCSLYNMKTRMLKLTTPLPGKTVIDLLRQDIVLDAYGKPMSIRGTILADDASVFSDGSNTPDPGDRSQKPVSAASNVMTALERNRMSSVTFTITPRRPRIAQLQSNRISSKGSPEPATPKIATWEELLVAGERNKKSSSIKSAGYGGKYVKGSSRRNAPAAATGTAIDSIQPWCSIAQAEKTIEEKRRIALLGSINRRTAEDVLNDSRHEFGKLQKKINKEVEDELFKRRGEQFKLIQSKFSTIHLGPITSVALEKMRSDAYVLTRDRKDNSSQAMPWFMHLREELRRENDFDDEVIDRILKKIARFQYEDGKIIPFAKEKLCLLVMSMPIHMLMSASMIHALVFVLAKVLEAAPQLLDVWLAARKLSRIKQVETSGIPRATKYL